MFKMGGFYLTARGRLVKIFNQFVFSDGYHLNAAIYTPGNPGNWIAVRYNTQGQCTLEPQHNNINATDTFESYGRFLTYAVWFDFAARTWLAQAKDLHGNVIVNLTGLEHRDRAMQLVSIGAEQRILTWMREAGYDEEIIKEEMAVDE